ncbi:MAG TPA: ABC transporter permease [Candidatus Dormibacteraeota bacterium]|nr:ABC transporter permease [Candidatus Dormibacteraeota bacterium]
MRRARRFTILGTAPEAWAATIVLIVAWRIAAGVSRPFLLPGPQLVWQELVGQYRQHLLVSSASVSFARVLGGVTAAFLVGLLVGTLMGILPRFAAFAHTYLNFIQGIPSLCWIVIAIIWFRPVEVRILFIVMMATLPSFTLQVYDGYRGISQDLKEMVRSLRPSWWQRFRYLTLPALVPPIVTIWKINLGAGTRDVVIAELVGSSTGIGLQINHAEEAFSMARVMAWTLVLVVFVLVAQKLLSLVEGRLLRWREDDSGGGEGREETSADLAPAHEAG